MTETTGTDPVASTLSAIQERWTARKQYSLGFDPVDGSRLLAAVEAALKLADEWEAKAKKIGGQIALEDCDGAVAGFKMIGYQNHRDHAKALRAALTGTEIADATAPQA
jgi:hypothetical protein